MTKLSEAALKAATEVIQIAIDPKKIADFTLHDRHGMATAIIQRLLDEKDAEVKRLKQQLAEARECLEQIVLTEGQDRGLVLQDHESHTKYDEELKCHVYQCENFSPLGDALILLWEQLAEATNTKEPSKAVKEK